MWLCVWCSAVEAEEKRIKDEMHKFKAQHNNTSTQEDIRPSPTEAHDTPDTEETEAPTQPPPQETQDMDTPTDDEAPAAVSTDETAEEGEASIDDQTRDKVEAGVDSPTGDTEEERGLEQRQGGEGEAEGREGGESGGTEGQGGEGKEEAGSVEREEGTVQKGEGEKGKEGGCVESGCTSMPDRQAVWSLYVVGGGEEGSGERVLVSSSTHPEKASLGVCKGGECVGVEVCVPSPVWLTSMADVALDVSPTHLHLTWPPVPSDWEGEGEGEVYVTFPFEVEEEGVRAKFRRGERMLRVIAPRLKQGL